MSTVVKFEKWHTSLSRLLLRTDPQFVVVPVTVWEGMKFMAMFRSNSDAYVQEVSWTTSKTKTLHTDKGGVVFFLIPERYSDAGYISMVKELLKFKIHVVMFVSEPLKDEELIDRATILSL